MKTLFKTISALVLLLTFQSATAQLVFEPITGFAPLPVVEAKPAVVQSNKIQVVFALDVTGSMGSLIQAAKDKIWTISNSLKQSNANLSVEIGIVAYRDRGDAFVTKIVDLSTNFDQVFSELNALRADGGGDEPESVNQALNDAVKKISWGHAPNDIRTIFLIGDCPPHMDYRNDVKYQKSCEEARQKDIVINTIQMGNRPATEAIWREIAGLANGEYNATDMNVNQVVIATPYDEEIKRKSMELEQSRTFYGTASEQEEAAKDVATRLEVTSTMSTETAARRADYMINATDDMEQYGEKELIQAVRNGNVNIAEVAEEDLPAELKDLSADERVEKVNVMVSERIEQEKELEELIQKRDEYVITNVDVEAASGSFTNTVLSNLGNQAKKKNITLSDKAKY